MKPDELEKEVAHSFIATFEEIKDIRRDLHEQRIMMKEVLVLLREFGEVVERHEYKINALTKYFQRSGFSNVWWKDE